MLRDPDVYKIMALFVPLRHVSNIGERNMHRIFVVVVVCFGVASFLVLVCILQVTGRIFICM